MFSFSEGNQGQLGGDICFDLKVVFMKILTDVEMAE